VRGISIRYEGYRKYVRRKRRNDAVIAIYDDLDFKIFVENNSAMAVI